MAHSILIVDDDEQVRDVVKRKLEQCGYDVCEAADGEEASNTLRVIPFDLVITDIIMPEKDGIQIIDLVRREYPGLKVVVISAPGNKLYLESAAGLGADRAFLKPLKLEELAEAVAELLPPAEG